MVKRVFAPGCGLMLHGPESARQIGAVLDRILGEAVPAHHVCCHHEPGLAPGTEVINVCPGCDKRFRTLYDGISTVSLWEVLAADRSIPLPDYGGVRMTVLDACPTRDQTRVHEAVRALLSRMNVDVVEPRCTKTKGICCGDSFFGILPTGEVEALMRKRASEMPVENVVVYCVSCVKAMHIGRRAPRYLIDLLLGRATVPGIFEPEAWHRELDAYIDEH